MALYIRGGSSSLLQDREMKHALAASMLIGMSLAFLVHFALIVHYGAVEIKEPSLFILIAEIVGLFFIFGYGCWYLVRGHR